MYFPEELQKWLSAVFKKCKSCCAISWLDERDAENFNMFLENYLVYVYKLLQQNISFENFLKEIQIQLGRIWSLLTFIFYFYESKCSGFDPHVGSNSGGLSGNLKWNF